MAPDQQFWNKQWTERSGGANPFVQKILEYLPAPNGETLLDLGCGDGRDAIFLAEQGFMVTAVDYSESGIEKLRAAHPDITALRRDIRSLDFANNSFDAIYAHLSLHYFDDAITRSIVAEIYRMLIPNGFFFVKCKSTKDPLCGRGKRIDADTFEYGHVRHFFSEKYLRRLLEPFEIVTLTSSESSYEGKHSAFVEAVARKK